MFLVCFLYRQFPRLGKARNLFSFEVTNSFRKLIICQVLFYNILLHTQLHVQRDREQFILLNFCRETSMCFCTGAGRIVGLGVEVEGSAHSDSGDFLPTLPFYNFPALPAHPHP